MALLLGLSSCGSYAHLPQATQVSSIAKDANVRKASQADISIAKAHLEGGLSAQALSKLDVDEINWNQAITFEADGSTAVSVPMRDGEAVVIGLEQTDDQPVIGTGTQTIDADGNLVFTSENLVTHVKSVTVLSPDGQTVIREERYTADGQPVGLGAQYTCRELRDRVDDACGAFHDAVIDMGVAVVVCGLTCGAGGYATVAAGALGLAWFGYKVIRNNSAYQNVSRQYHASCG